MARWSLVRVGACLPLALFAFTGCSNCAETSGEEALAQAATELAPAWEGLAPDSAENWDFASADTSTYDSCKPLSWIVIPTAMPSKDAPYEVALFHNGVFSGTSEARPYLGEPKVTRVSDNEIQVERTWYLDEEKTMPKPAVATYVWNDDKSRTVRTGGLPPNEYAAGGPQAPAE
ncbi:LppP/LprE family lipoprotein [Arcanobacterium buesumense]|uniref:LppP/LprE family lipoprotein n=1 Tax=Arcanobacterium buesumense TaxID=2722751 RepID=A0A6H2EMR1_9ACTO|nr:LppP/LprE family lipoprotein [Arcanobacterium buesumense]QJC22368.1 LppP/LprE family lipoprotein [Arcanobacterium buesumense]